MEADGSADGSRVRACPAPVTPDGSPLSAHAAPFVPTAELSSAAAAYVPASAQLETVADGAIISANCATGVALAQQAVKIAGRVAAERAAATAVLEATKNLTGLTQKSAELCKEQEQRQSMYSQNQQALQQAQQALQQAEEARQALQRPAPCAMVPPPWAINHHATPPYAAVFGGMEFHPQQPPYLAMEHHQQAPPPTTTQPCGMDYHQRAMMAAGAMGAYAPLQQAAGAMYPGEDNVYHPVLGFRPPGANPYDRPPGANPYDWKCDGCANINYGFRTRCNRCATPPSPHQGAAAASYQSINSMACACRRFQPRPRRALLTARGALWQTTRGGRGTRPCTSVSTPCRPARCRPACRGASRRAAPRARCARRSSSWDPFGSRPARR